MGDYMGIRYGRVPHGSDLAEWSFVSHCDCDGIGGFARLLRERGAVLPQLPEMKQHAGGVILPLWRLWRGNSEKQGCAERRDWSSSTPPSVGASDAVAWHLFTEEETNKIRVMCREKQVTVNSHLLKQLDQAIRLEIRRPALKIPWMVPVNLRGKINYADDTENHVSCVEVCIAADDTAETIHARIQRRLKDGEHRANHFLFMLGRFLSEGTKMKILAADRTKPAGNIGAFSNLGVWDSEKRIETNDSWLFCPPVVSGQLLGAGCVTFQNRLGLSIQGHAGPSCSREIATGWMKRWVERI